MLNFYELLKAGVPLDEINEMIEDEINEAQAQIDAEAAKRQEEMKRASDIGDAREKAIAAVVDYCNLVLPSRFIAEIDVPTLVSETLENVVKSVYAFERMDCGGICFRI